MAEATTDPVRLPPTVPIPKWVAAAGVLLARKATVRAVGRRYGGAFTVKVPVLGKAVVISDPALIKDLYATSSDLVTRPSNLGSVLGPGSTFSLHGAEHRQRRKLLMPPFHGKRMSGYEAIVEEEVLRETATWPEGHEFATQASMRRITLNVILRAVFGAEGALTHAELCEQSRRVFAEFVLEPRKLFANCLIEILRGYERSLRLGCFWQRPRCTRPNVTNVKPAKVTYVIA